MLRRLLRVLVIAAVALAAAGVGWALLYRVVPVPATPLMLLRAAGGSGMKHDWVPLERIAPSLARAVIASEDTKFCGHTGFDWDAITDALEDNEEGGRLKGGSTITQQTAKNAFLWPDRTWVRKGLEAGFTVLIEALWPKRRTMEVYLNIVEWADGVYGAEAAARHHFGKPAAALTRREAALLSVLLPSPRNWTPATPYVQRRAGVIERRMAVVERSGLDGCVR